MSWENRGDGLWEWTADDERHLLAFVGDELREYHEVPGGAVTVHVYGVTDGRASVRTDAPLVDAPHLATYEVPAEHAPWVRALDDREVFEWLADAGYAS